MVLRTKKKKNETQERKLRWRHPCSRSDEQGEDKEKTNNEMELMVCLPVGRTAQAEGTANAKILRSKRASHVQVREEQQFG